MDPTDDEKKRISLCCGFTRWLYHSRKGFADIDIDIDIDIDMLVIVAFQTPKRSCSIGSSQSKIDFTFN